MGLFECITCNQTFEGEGNKKEWHDPYFGYCWKKVMECPICGQESEEYKKPKNAKKCCSGSSCQGSCSGCSCGC